MRVTDAASRGVRLVAAHLLVRTIPFHATLYLTPQCNLRCVYCQPGSAKGPGLSTEEWQGVLDELAGLGTKRVLLCGGEPLLRSDLGDIVAHARQLGMSCALGTNGTLVPQRREVIRHLSTVVVSLDGPPHVHDANRGAGSHAAALAGIAAAGDCGVAVKVNAVLNANSAHGIDWLVEYCERERLPITLNVMRSEPVGLWRDAASCRLSDAQMRALIDRVIEAKKRSRWVILSVRSLKLIRRWPDFTRDRLTLAETRGSYPGPRCQAGRFHCAIAADGRLFPCGIAINQVPARDVRQSGVSDALAVAGRHGCATCMSACLLEVNALFSLDPRVIGNLARTYLRSAIE